MAKAENIDPSDPKFVSKMTNVLKALQLSSVGANAGQLKNIQNNVNPVLPVQDLEEILDMLVDSGLTIREDDSHSYFITDQGRRVLAIGV